MESLSFTYCHMCVDMFVDMLGIYRNLRTRFWYSCED